MSRRADEALPHAVMTERRFPLCRLHDGRALVNLGSSARTAPGWTNIDSSPILRVAQFPRLSRLLWRARILSDDRYSRISKLGHGSVVWNLVKGIPYPAETFDVVYHSHLLEHIDRQHAPGFLAECFRVLKRGGTIRIVVPDLERLARAYVRALDGATPTENPEYAAALDGMFDQMVPRVPRERMQQPALVRLLETVFIGDTARSGALHRWMYDRFSLSKMLGEVGFNDISVCDYQNSRIEGWRTFGLDEEPDGSPYKPGSLYIEANRP